MLTYVGKISGSLSLAIFSAMFLTTVAEAQTVRFVASNGDNANNCRRETPCLTLQRGINATPVGGELQILSSGAYGNASIARSITISAVGVSATVGALTIDAPAATVVLRGLLLNGTAVPANTNGISIVNAAAVHIVGCGIERFFGTGVGIRIDADNVEVFVSDTTSRNNGFSGLNLASSGARLAIDNSRFENNGSGGVIVNQTGTLAETTITRVVSSGNAGSGFVNRGGRMNITATTAANNGGNGFHHQGAGEMTIERSVSRGNTTAGLRVDGGGLARIGNSVVTNNGTGLLNSDQGGTSTLLSRGNNTVTGNGTNTSGTIGALGGI